jgi:hypothetical protein
MPWVAVCAGVSPQTKGRTKDFEHPSEGVNGTPTDMLCTNCHKAAGSDAAYTTTDCHDFVYTHLP